MADMTAPSGQAPAVAPPIRTDEEIVPRIRWVQIGKSNCSLDLDKKQSNTIFKMADTIQYDKKAGSYRYQLEEQWFVLIKDTLREALQITPINNNKAFVAPPSADFSAKGTKREVFGMPIPGSLITADIREASYYQEYQENVAKHRRFIASETGEAEEVPTVEPQVTDEDANFQKALEESMKTAYALPQGPLPPVVIREPESGKYQPLPKVPGKGKAKVTEEQVALDLLSLQKAKKKSRVDQYIFQRRTFTTTGSSRQTEPSHAELEQSESEPTKKVVHGADKVGQSEIEGQARPDPGAKAGGQMGSDIGAQDETSEGQAGSNLDEIFEGQAGPDLGNAGGEEQMDEGFTATVYSKVQENLKLTIEEHVLLEDPASSSGTMSSLQHLSKDIIFEDLFFNDKPSEANNDKTTKEIKVESMVSVTIQQEMSILLPLMWTIPPMTSPIVDLTSRPESPKVSKAVSEVVTEAVDWAMQAPLQNHFRDLPKADMKEILHQRMNSRKTWLKYARERKRVASLLKRHLGLHLISHILLLHQQDHPERQELLELRDHPKSHHHHHHHLHPPLKTVRLKAMITELKPQDLEGPAFKIVKVFHPDVIHLQYQIEECHKLLTDSVDFPILRYNVSKPLPLGGPPGQVLIQSDFFFNKDLEYLRYGSKGSRPALSISKMKAAYYPDVGLEQMVPDQFWINEECKYDISVMTHMRILSVVRIKVFSLYGYYYMKRIVLRRANLNEHVIAERDFKYLYPSDFEDMYLLNLQGHLKHLSPKDKKILTTAINQWTRHLMMMRFNEIHKYIDGTLQQINKALDYRVKEFRINRMNPEAFENKEDIPQPGELCWWKT
uniref:Uncharacterized protein n=1 Tax=Tanacetum cinerariifolium TaxID=118510 RepID=A0A6L2P4A8_TANCI|nr:hypothetical protein [Tanacetum cinerariifolium]